MKIKDIHIKEAATAGATASGNIATVVNPHVANPSRNSVAYTGTPGVSGKGPVKQVKGGTYNTGKNALDGDALLMSSKEPQMLRRRIQEGSLYTINEEQLNELWPALLGGAAVIGAGIYGVNKLGKWMDKQKGKTQAAHDKKMQNAGLATDTPKKKKKKKANEDYHSPAGEIAQDHADDFDTLMKQRSKAAHDVKSSKRIAKTEKSKRKTAKAAGFHAMMSRRPLSGIAKDSAQKGHQPAWSGLGEGLRIEKRLPDWRKKANQEASGITDIEKAAGASKPTNQGQTDVEKSTIADVDRTTLHVEKPKKRIARAPQLGRDA